MIKEQKTIAELVGEVMAKSEMYRLHKNRYKLYLRVCTLAEKQFSPESIMRAQRRFWEHGLFLPRTQKGQIEWARARTIGEP